MRRTGVVVFIAIAGMLATAGPASAKFGNFSTFEPYDTGATVFGADVGDINRDGNPDIVAAVDPGGSTTSGHVSLLYGRASGIFNNSGRKTLKDAHEPEGIAIGKFNGDKYLDFAAANYGNSTVSIFLGTKSGVPKLAHTYHGGPGNWIIDATDLNGDGKTDLVTGNYDTSGISVLLGNGDGTFKAHVDYPSGIGAVYGMALGKLNSDSRTDAVITDSSGNLQVFPGASGGKFKPPLTPVSSGASSAYGIVLGKFDPGSTLDAVVPDYSGDQVFFLPGIGDGTFGTPVASTSVGGPNGIATADFNQDGKLDLAVGEYNSTGVRILNGVGDGTFTFHENLGGTDGTTEFVKAAKFDGDAGPDVLAGTDAGTGNYAKVGLEAWLNPPNGH